MHGAEVIDSDVVLREFPGPLGLLLWKTVRSTGLWSEAAEEERTAVFGKNAYRERQALIEAVAVPSEIGAQLRKAASVLRKRAHATTVGAACRAIAGWAEAKGATGTALEFFQAAALALPLDAEAAYEAGRVARSRAEHQRAETWFRHAILRARRARNRYEFTRSYIGLGKVELLRENHPQAKRAFIRGLRAAKRFSIRPLISTACQELALLAMRTGSTTDAHRYTRAALDASDLDDSGLPCLVYEYGAFLLDTGHFREALRTITSLPDAIVPPTERLRVAIATARAAAGARELRLFEDAWTTAERLLDDPAAVDAAPAAALNLARAGLLAGQKQRAMEAAERALRLAADRGNASLEEEATSLLRIADGRIRPASAVEPRRGTPRVRELVEDLATAMGRLQPT
jgi:tetratricopeptide (TPR) repeat protein